MAAVECVHDHVRAVCLLIILRGGGRKRDGGVGPKAPVKIVATAIDIEANSKLDECIFCKKKEN